MQAGKCAYLRVCADLGLERMNGSLSVTQRPGTWERRRVKFPWCHIMKAQIWCHGQWESPKVLEERSDCFGTPYSLIQHVPTVQKSVCRGTAPSCKQTHSGQEEKEGSLKEEGMRVLDPSV